MHITTPRLTLDELKINDAQFIYELVNTPGWLKYIGNRNIYNIEDATAYTQKIIANPDIKYRVVYIKEAKIPIGVVTFIKRAYLQHHDIGFAFLPQHNGHGYAYESVSTVLDKMMNTYTHSKILATTIKENHASINLLEKLGLIYSHEIIQENEIIKVYEIVCGKY